MQPALSAGKEMSAKLQFTRLVVLNEKQHSVSAITGFFVVVDESEKTTHSLSSG